MFTMIPMIIFIIFVIVLSGVVFSIISGLWVWHQNNQATRIAAPVMVVSKREYIRHRNNGSNHAGSSSTKYYVTFEFEDGKRMEFAVKPRVVGLIAVEDKGMLTYQGTRFLSFERELG